MHRARNANILACIHHLLVPEPIPLVMVHRQAAPMARMWRFHTIERGRASRV